MQNKWMMIASVMGLTVMALAGSAGAVLVEGTSGGEFTNLQSCIEGFNCEVSSDGTQIDWGLGWQGTSSLTALDTSISFDTATGGNDVAIGQLVWTNTPIISFLGPASFTATWTLDVSFTEPVGSADPSDSESFNLTVINTTNPSSDIIQGLTLTDLANLSWDLNGVSVGGLEYQLLGGNGSLTQSGSSYTWLNPENTTSTLLITADFTASPSSPSAVPEPATLLLLGTGLVGVAAGAWRRRRSEPGGRPE